MNYEQRLNHMAERYRAQGYQVVVQPDPDVLPPFAKDFKVEIFAAREGGGVLASAKKSPAELEADPNIPRYVEITNQQPGWRFDVAILGADSPFTNGKRKGREPTEDDIRQSLNEVERMLGAGFVRASFAAAWATLEAAMRRRLRAAGEEVEWGTMPRTMLNELYSAGILPTATLRELEGLFQLRSEVVHGFAAPDVEPKAVQFVVETARRLLTESERVRQPA
jgi:hypothetical protein